MCKRRGPRAKSGRICAEIVHGYNRHPAWDEASCHACYCAEELETLEGIIPGIDGSARAYSDVSESRRSASAQSRPVREICRPGRRSSASAPNWTAASPAAGWPKTAPPKR